MRTKIRIFRKTLILRYSHDSLSVFNTKGLCSVIRYIYNKSCRGGGPNFISFDEAVNALKSQGVNGAVVINIFPGTYEVHTVIPQITGASSVNTITFQSSTGDSTQVTLSYTYTSTAAENYLIKLDGTDYITFKSITFNAYGGDTNYGRIFHITAGANNNKFLNNSFKGKTTNSSYTQLIYSAGTADENNLFKNNLFFYGYSAIMISGTSYTTHSTGTIIRNNVFKEQTNQAGLQILAKMIRIHKFSVFANNIFEIFPAIFFQVMIT